MRLFNFKNRRISLSSASSFDIRRNLANVGSGSASFPIHAGYSSRSLTTGGSCPLKTPRLFIELPAFMGSGDVEVPQ